MSLRVAAYIRVSTDEQAEHGISIPAQKSRLTAYCRAQGWSIHHFFIDDGYSGKDMERPAIRQLMAQAESRLFDIVLVLKLDRLSRRQKDILHLLEDIFEPNKIGFKSVTETFDTTTPFGKAALGMMAVFAQLERETIVERVRMAKRESARQGRFPGGPAPYGYSYNPGEKRLEVDEIQAGTVRLIYDEYITGRTGYQHIAERLEKYGIPGPANRGWNRNFIRKVLTNPVYAGLVGHRGTLYPGRHEPIISPEKWHEAQSLINGKKNIRHPAGEKGLLTGIIWCGECGARMRIKNVWQNYPLAEPQKIIRYYVCYSQDGTARHMALDRRCKCGYKRAVEIETRAFLELSKFNFSQGLLLQAVEETLGGSAGKNIHARAADQAARELAALNKKLERWYGAFEKGLLDPAELFERVKELKARKDLLQSNIDQQPAPPEENNLQPAGPGRVLEIVTDLSRLWEEATTGEKREILVNTIKSVTVYRDNRIEIIFNN
ncbi:MAG: recombinase family protein [Bacillota bacterium]